MAARTGFRFLPGFVGSPAVGAHCICALTAPPGSLGLHRKSQACSGGYAIRPYRVRSAMVHATRRCGTGGHEGRPYTLAFGPFVGAGFMPARNGFRFLPGFDGSAAVGAHCICALTAPPGSLGLHRKSQACSGGYAIRPYRVRSAMVHATRRCGTGGHEGRPYTPRLRSFRRGGLYARPEPGSDFCWGSLVPPP